MVSCGPSERNSADGSSSAKLRWPPREVLQLGEIDGREIEKEAWTHRRRVDGGARRRRRFVWLHLHSLAHCAGGGVCVLGRPLGRVRRWEELWEERERTGVPFLRVTPVVVALFRKWTATWVFMGQFIPFHFGRGQLRYRYL